MGSRICAMILPVGSKKDALFRHVLETM